MQNTNQRCNALQSVVGMYMHSCNAPEASIELLAHMGCSVSTTTINSTVTSLSKKSAVTIQNLGMTLLTSLLYDNLDADIK